jgi:DNA-binding transcriptional LysR family regulator
MGRGGAKDLTLNFSPSQLLNSTMDLHQIEIFCTLIKLRSFSKAADALYLTQPTVSGHMKNLETELGVKLLDRLGKRVVPTEEGEVLFRHGEKLLALRDQARQEIEQLSGRVSGTLKIGGSTIPGAYIIPELIGAFKKNYPLITVQLLIEDTALVADAVLTGGLCLGVVGAKIDDPRLESHAFLKDELVLAVPGGHPWAKKKSVSLGALKKEPFILREEGSGTRRIMEDRFRKEGFSTGDLSVVAEVGSSDAVRQAVKAGLGVSILSVRALQDDVQAGRLATLRIAGITLDRNFSIILLRGRSRTPLCKAFLDFIRAQKQARTF